MWSRALRACVIAFATLSLAAACGQAGAPASNAAKPATPSAGSAAQPAAAAALKPVTLSLDFIPNGYQAPFIVAAKNGYFKAGGLTVDISAGKGSLTTVEQVASGAATFGFADFGAASQAIAKGAPVKAVMVLTQQTPLCIATRASAGVTTPAQLKGLTFAIVAGGIDSYMLPAFLAATHVPPADVKTVTVSPAEKLLAFENKRVDALVGFANFEIPALEAKGIKLNTMCFPQYGINTLEDSVFASTKTIGSEPSTVQAFVKATTQGYEFAAQHPNQAVADFLAFFPNSGVTASLAKTELEASLTREHTAATKGKPLGWTALADVRQTLATYGKYLGLKTNDPPSTFYTNQFIPSGGAGGGSSAG